MIGIVVTILLLGGCVFVHELGHFLVMRRNGIQVLEFALGFGPRLVSWEGQGGTIYSLCALPFGGFVRPESEGSGSMLEARAWVKFKVALAGPMMNCVAAFILLTIMLYATGAQSPLLQHELVVWLPELVRPVVVAFAASFVLALATPALFAYLVISNFVTMMSGLAGPIGIVQMGSGIGGSEPTALTIILGAAYMAYLINVGLAGFNLMPLYPLDGGHCVKALLEKLLGRRDGLFFTIFNYVTGGLMIALVLLVCTGDILRLVGISLGS